MKYIVCTTIILLFILTPVVYSLPDLQVWSLEYSKETGRLVANIYNQAPDPSEGFVVKFYDNDVFIGEYFYNKTLPRYSIVAVYVKPNLEEGQHNFKAIVDANNTIAESREDNNEETLAIEYNIDKTPIAVSPSIPLTEKEEQNIITYIIIAIIVVVIFILIILKFISSWHKKRKMRAKLTLSSPSSNSL